LIARAAELKLARTRTWQRLLHYRPGVFGWSSEADSRVFFLAADGSSNPEAELEATLRAFFRPPRKTDAEIQHPFCRFPARRAWLAAELQIDFGRLPTRRCPRYEDFRRRMRPQAATLVFSAYYLNNPASAFGHTFLRINKDPGENPEGGQDLLDYGIDYSANVDTNNSFIYAFKGLTGMFPGTFRRLPYYYKVREYNDFESRDMWEYELNFSQAELDMMLAHIWELGSNYFDYFYLTENCSYHILAILEVARPSADLLSKLGWPVIPADTIKALFKEGGLVRSVHFRPSNRTQFRARLESLSSNERSALALLAADPEAPLPDDLSVAARVRVLDAALDYLDYSVARDVLKTDAEDERKQRLLERRAALAVPSRPLNVDPPPEAHPENGHGSQRWGLGSGYSTSQGYFHQLDGRLALHG
ncbi:MAG: DUF4105 domain-containing protein, partial [Myxococcales bacterium]|nr:DUF4105 domain-containing protein [Myxococcales bacterium]